MKKFLIIFISLLFFPFFSFSLIIVEVQIMGENSSDDYIKIYNSSEKDIDASDYKLRKRTETGKEYSIKVFPKEVIIPSKNYFIWANSKNNFHISLNSNIWSTATIAKNNSIALIGKDNEILDSLSWGKNKKPFNENIFSENPEKRLKRIKKDGIYQNTKDNNKDFYIDPLLQIKNIESDNVSNLSKENIKENQKIEKIDLNNASVEELVKIIHIGEARAKELISLRPFYSFEDLIRVKGIGEKSAKDIEKQGLAYIDPTLFKETEKKKEIEKEEIKKNSNNNYKTASIKNIPYNSFLVAIIVSFFSAGIIYLLKKSLK